MIAKIGQSILRTEYFKDSSGHSVEIDGTAESTVREKYTGDAKGSAQVTIVDGPGGEVLIVVPDSLTSNLEPGDVIIFDAKITTTNGYVLYTDTFEYEMEDPVT